MSIELTEDGAAVRALCCRNDTGLRIVRVPEGVKRVGPDAFYGCRALTVLSLPEGLEEIGMSAFCGCISLREAVLPGTVRAVGDDAFANCASLRRAELPEGLRELGGHAFENCAGLEELVLPPGLRELYRGSFAGCRSLRRVVLPASLEHLSPYAFYGCSSLEQIEHPQPRRFASALAWTPYGRRAFGGDVLPPQLPMELLYRVSGAQRGTALAARGCADVDIDLDYSFYETSEPCVYERRAETGPGLYEHVLLDGAMERIPGIAALGSCPPGRFEALGGWWRAQIKLAARKLLQPGPNRAKVLPMPI